jgi:hypothetical protein
MARKSVVKGKRFERDVAAALSPIYPNARRGLVQARSGNEAADVEGTPFWVECKTAQRISLQAALAQATENTDGRPPLAICKVTANPPTATLFLSDFIKLIEVIPNEYKSQAR